MDIIEKNLKKFIDDIEHNTISKNEVIVGRLNDKVVDFLSTVSIEVQTVDIYLSVKSYKHMQRDLKKRLNKSVPKEVIYNIFTSFKMPYKVFFDTEKKHCNLIYIDKKDEIYFKIVVQPNYMSKIGKINMILTAGIIDRNVMKSKFYKDISEHGWESNPR